MNATSRHWIIAATALAVGIAGISAGVVTSNASAGSAAATATTAATATSSHRLPVKQIESIEQADGTYGSGVLTIDSIGAAATTYTARSWPKTSRYNTSSTSSL
jgi:hypothetical protein